MTTLLLLFLLEELEDVLEELLGLFQVNPWTRLLQPHKLGVGKQPPDAGLV